MSSRSAGPGDQDQDCRDVLRARGLWGKVCEIFGNLDQCVIVQVKILNRGSFVHVVIGGTRSSMESFGNAEFQIDVTLKSPTYRDPIHPNDYHLLPHDRGMPILEPE